jgi:hypothetical protein
MTKNGDCPRCGGSRVDEYTHYECPSGSTTSDHHHLVCADTACNHEWVESLPG